MRNIHNKMTAWMVGSCLLTALWVLPALAQDQSGTSQSSTTTDQTTSSTTTKKKKKSKKDQDQTAPATSGNSSDASTSASTSTAKKTSSGSAGTVSDSDIAAAKASGKVWVNLDSGIYHKGGRWYGKTKNGKFMTVQEAKAAGYKPAKKE